MKSLFFALAFAFSLNASATSLKPGFLLTLPKVIENGERTELTARVIVDLASDEITVQLFNDICGQFRPHKPGEFTCRAAAILMEEYTVPVVATRTTCGSVYYVGAEDNTPVDGLKIDIEVADHSKRVCMDTVAQYSGAKMRLEALRTQTVREVKMLNELGF